MNAFKEIPLTKGKVAIVDAADYDFLMQWKWQALFDPKNGRWYARRSERVAKARRKTVRMHRVIMNPAGDIHVDHRDGDGLNNRRSNLRAATPAQNSANRLLNRDNTSGWKGVAWYKASRKWTAYITAHGRRIHLGYFSDKEQAVQARADAAKQYHGEFAR